MDVTPGSLSPVSFLLVLLSQPVLAVKPAFRIAHEAGRFEFVDREGDPTKPLMVYTYLPTK